MSVKSQQRPGRVRRRSSHGYSFSALIIAGFNLLVWLMLLLPASLISDSSTVENGGGLNFVLIVFVATNLGALAMAAMALIKSRFKKAMAGYGLLANVVMVFLNLSLFMY